MRIHAVVFWLIYLLAYIFMQIIVVLRQKVRLIGL